MKEAIDLYLKKRGKTIKDILPEIGMTEAGYYAAIRNDSMKVITLQKIAKALSVSICQFFTENDNNLTEPKADSGNDTEIVKTLKRTIKAQEIAMEAMQVTINMLQKEEARQITYSKKK
ncbi:MAG: hypothetical protein A3F72_03120 [Bacteroidetes bacterium RIFCSPLOWO2_12_FULL_35_15]|nr:MAG: hypothetical protein A3F72_03120 [Bacteroidetes bacterium RIFCSPLOWO2_12_FULL_35_15]